MTASNGGATDPDGMPVASLVGLVNRAIHKAGLVRQYANSIGAYVSSVEFVLHTVVVRSAGAGVDLRVPIVNWEVSAGVSGSTRHVHTIDLTLQPLPPKAQGLEAAEQDVEAALDGALETVRGILHAAKNGDPPWSIGAGTIDLSFEVTKEGRLSLGIKGSHDDVATQTLRLHLTPHTPVAAPQ